MGTRLSVDTRVKVAHAMKIIGPTARKKQVERAIFFDTGFVNRLKNFKKSGRFGILTKGQKTAARHLEIALRRLKMALRDADLVMHLKLDIPIDEIDVENALAIAVVAAKTKLGKPRKLNEAKRYAVRAAARLLQVHNLPLTVTRNGRFCHLAVVINGDPSANLYHYCCEFVKEGQDRV
jgi:hypothetical protein